MAYGGVGAWRLLDSLEPGIARKFLQFAPYAFFLLDPDETVRATNEMGARQLGRTEHQIIGVRLADFYASNVAERILTRARDAKRTRSEVMFEDREGDKCYQTTISPILDDHGGVGLLAIYRVDITESKRADDDARVSQAHFRRLLDNMQDAVIVHATAEGGQLGQLTYVNQSACTPLGHARAEFLGLWPRHVFGDVGGDRGQRIVKALSSNEQFETELVADAIAVVVIGGDINSFPAGVAVTARAFLVGLNGVCTSASVGVALIRMSWNNVALRALQTPSTNAMIRKPAAGERTARGFGEASRPNPEPLPCAGCFHRPPQSQRVRTREQG